MIGQIVRNSLCAVLIGILPPTSAIAQSDIGGFLDGVKKIMQLVGQIDQMIDVQIEREKRRALIRELTRLNDALSDLEHNKAAFNEMIVNYKFVKTKDIDWERIGERIRTLRKNVASVVQQVYKAGRTLDVEPAVAGFTIEHALTQGLNEKMNSLTQIEAALVRKAEHPGETIDIESIEREGDEAVKSLQAVREQVVETIRKLRTI